VKKKTCEHCGSTFGTYGPEKFCSPKCYHSSRTRRVGICEQCGAEYDQYADRLRYCSIACSAKGRRRDDKECPNCGTMFWPSTAKRKYCSVACSNEARGVESRDGACDRCGILMTNDAEDFRQQVGDWCRACAEELYELGTKNERRRLGTNRQPAGRNSRLATPHHAPQN